MKPTRSPFARALRLAPLAAAMCLLPACARADALRAPVAAEIARWRAQVMERRDSSEVWTSVKETFGPLLDRAASALDRGRTTVALQRLAAARAPLAAAVWLAGENAAGLADSATFEREWQRLDRALAADKRPATPGRFATVRPAVLRALAEAAQPQVRVYHEASLDYGRSTQPEYGLYYLGQAVAQSEFLEFATKLSVRGGPAPPALRSIAGELDALEGEILATYRPPLSIDRHPEFIGVGAALKEARELDAAGLRFGALLRYLQAAQRFAPLRPAAAPLEAATLRSQLAAWAARVEAPATDHGIARVFVEAAAGELDGAAPDSTPPIAAAIVRDVLPRYFAALGPAPAPRAAVRPEVTVTLVRWPYT